MCLEPTMPTAPLTVSISFRLRSSSSITPSGDEQVKTRFVKTQPPTNHLAVSKTTMTTRTTRQTSPAKLTTNDDNDKNMSTLWHGFMQQISRKPHITVHGHIRHVASRWTKTLIQRPTTNRETSGVVVHIYTWAARCFSCSTCSTERHGGDGRGFDLLLRSTTQYYLSFSRDWPWMKVRLRKKFSETTASEFMILMAPVTTWMDPRFSSSSCPTRSTQVDDVTVQGYRRTRVLSWTLQTRRQTHKHKIGVGNCQGDSDRVLNKLWEHAGKIIS